MAKVPIRQPLLEKQIVDLKRRAKLANLWDATVPPPAFYDPERDGVTFSLLSGWRQCREQARLALHAVTSRGSSQALVYGTIVHAVLQHLYEGNRLGKIKGIPSRDIVLATLADIETQFKQENPRASQEVLQYLEFSMVLAEATMPFYVNYWKKDFLGDVRWRAVESEFKIPRVVFLYDGRIIKTFIKGKMDGCFDDPALKLFETKTKTRIDEGTIADVLTLDLQVHIYMWAMHALFRQAPEGVRYNIIRRPALRQKQSESLVQFAQRCAADIKARPDFYFIRMDMSVTRRDMDAFDGEFQDLLQDFLSWWYGVAGHYKNSGSCENKYGTCPMLPICGPDRDYSRFYLRKTVFRELEEV